MSRSPHQLAIYIEALTRFRQGYLWAFSPSQHYLKAVSVQEACGSKKGKTSPHCKGTGGGEEPLMARVQLTGQPEAVSSPRPLTTRAVENQWHDL